MFEYVSIKLDYIISDKSTTNVEVLNKIENFKDIDILLDLFSKIEFS